ncbi:MAG: SpoIID/LytB domain-containing protein, partial [Patescibacteria group bacterium]
RTSYIEVLFSADDLEKSAHQFQYFNANLNTLSNTIGRLGEEITIFESNQATAKKLRDDLAFLRSQYQSRLSSSQRQLSSTSSQLASVKSSIKNLTAKQEQLILEKFAASGGSETIGESAPSSKPVPAAPFSPSWMIGTYGYPHRIGMSQYGARGRAIKGQSYQTILSAYYGRSATKATNIPAKITVNGCNEYGQCWSNVRYDFETYVKHIYEMPSSWPQQALRAQAIAARTYALRYALQGKSICPSQSCQVIKKEINATAWQQAVDATKGMTVGGNNPLPTFYHSAAGGYTLSKTTWVSYWIYKDGIKDFYNSSTAYEQIGGSPWYHAGWGDRYRSGGYNPWMSTEEFSDIFNSFLLCGAKNSSGVYELKPDCSYMQYLSPVDRGGWPMTTVRNKLTELGITPLTSLSAVVSTFVSPSQANTASVYVSGNIGPLTFSGRHFRDIFTLRAKGLWSPTYRFDIGYCASSGCTNPDFR